MQGINDIKNTSQKKLKRDEVFRITNPGYSVKKYRASLVLAPSDQITHHTNEK